MCTKKNSNPISIYRKLNYQVDNLIRYLTVDCVNYVLGNRKGNY